MLGLSRRQKRKDQAPAPSSAAAGAGADTGGARAAPVWPVGKAVRVEGERGVVCGPARQFGGLTRWPVARCADRRRGAVTVRDFHAGELEPAEPFPELVKGDAVRAYGHEGVVVDADATGGVVEFTLYRLDGGLETKRRHKLPRWHWAVIADKLESEDALCE